MQQKLFYEKLKKTKHKFPIIFSWLECAVPRTQSCCSLGCCDLQSIGTCWWLIAVAWIGYTGYWERFWLQLACWCASLASSGLALQHTDRLWAKLGSLVSGASQVCSKLRSAVTVSFPAPQHCERNLHPKTWCSVTGTLLLLPDDNGL